MAEKVVIQSRSKIPALRLVLNSRDPHAIFLARVFALKKTAWVSGGGITSLARFSVEASVLLAIWCGRWESNPHEEKSPEDFHAVCGFRRPDAALVGAHTRFAVWTIPSPSPGKLRGLGAARLVSTPSPFRGLGSGLPLQVSPNLGSSASPVSRRALKFS